ncbi:MAG: transporter substrate-binding protein [Paenibacillaceae bacterium]|jgi:putative aldouronate transport system substrate-binding protein|nr:transporter substrate-binding protein [Paenibacillaceae bacterium]
MNLRPAVLCALLLVSGTLASCGGRSGSGIDGTGEDKPFYLTMGLSLTGELPPKNNMVEQAIEEYTGTALQIQWIPYSAYEEKVRLMIAAGELPKLIKLGYSPTMIATLKSEQFWEIGPYLPDYKQLQAVDQRYYENISVNGKIYGIPLFRDLGRAAIQYRKDWFDRLGLKLPVTLEDWYQVIRAMTLGDPDGNGKQDTYGLVLEKRYNQEISSILTRISVSQGGPAKWKVEDGRFTPEFMTEPFYETMKLFRRLYQENLINRDFAIMDTIETTKMYESGRAGLMISGGNAQTWKDMLVKASPGALVEVAPLTGPSGRRLPGEPGNAGFLAIPKDAVKTEEEVKKILGFLDRLMEPTMQALLINGLENRHWVEKNGHAEMLDRTLHLKEVKPYRDMLPHLTEPETEWKRNLQPELYRKSQRLGKENEAYIVPNPALTLDSAMYVERGRELEILIADAETKFIMGKLEEAGWLAELEKWRQSGGDRMISEYEEAYAKKQ